MQHVATRADIADLRAGLRAELHSLNWRLIGAIIAVGAIVAGVLGAAIRFWS